MKFVLALTMMVYCSTTMAEEYDDYGNGSWPLDTVELDEERGDVQLETVINSDGEDRQTEIFSCAYCGKYRQYTHIAEEFLYCADDLCQGCIRDKREKNIGRCKRWMRCGRCNASQYWVKKGFNCRGRFGRRFCTRCGKCD